MQFVIIGGGPAGNSAASAAARFGADVTLIERDLIGGSAHLRDCIPSKAMVAVGNALDSVRRARHMGLDVELAGSTVDMGRVTERITEIWQSLNAGITGELSSQNVRLVDGAGELLDDHTVRVADSSGADELIEADAILLATGSRPRIPAWAPVDAKRVLTSRDAYSLDAVPEHMVIVGSGVTGVEFVHIFAALGSKVTLVASRRHVLPGKDPEVAYALEEALVDRGVEILKGARASSIDVSEDGVRVDMQDGRSVTGSHALLAVGSVPNTESLGLSAAGVEMLTTGHISVDPANATNVEGIFAAGDITDKFPLSSLAAAQGRMVGRHVAGQSSEAIDYGSVAQAIFTDPEIADVGIAEADAFGQGRKIRVTKVPFSANPKALIEADLAGFVKILSDPLTGQVLGGSIVGRNAAELIAVIALAVRARLTVGQVVESVNVHPSLVESLTDAAE